MKHEENEWISISDCMGGVVAVLIVLFVISIVINIAQNESQRQSRNASVDKALGWLGRQLETDPGLSDCIEIDFQSRIVTLKNSSFKSLDACLKPETRDVLRRWSPYLGTCLENNQQLYILVEGHSDNKKFGKTVQRECGSYDDNYSLSAVRARQARMELVNGWKEELTKRVAIAGYGPDRPVSEHASDEQNRRVEIRLIYEDARK